MSKITAFAAGFAISTAIIATVLIAGRSITPAPSSPSIQASDAARLSALRKAGAAPDQIEEITSPCQQQAGTFARSSALRLDGCNVIKAERPLARYECKTGDRTSTIVHRIGRDTIVVDCSLNVPNPEWDPPGAK